LARAETVSRLPTILRSQESGCGIVAARQTLWHDAELINVRSGRVVISSGISAGINMSLAVIGQRYGEEIAEASEGRRNSG
jgi:hypothetical protein